VHILSLSLLAVLLVFDGATTARVVSRAPTERAALDAAQVANIVSDINPALSVAQKRRIGEAVIRNSRKYEVSRKGAVGLMQVMPHMVGGMHLAGNLTTIESNIEAGCAILADNIRRLGEDDGISAYFWGSEIRGVAYLDRVREARATIRRLSRS
jgi:hypothetical protein